MEGENVDRKGKRDVRERRKGGTSKQIGD